MSYEGKRGAGERVLEGRHVIGLFLAVILLSGLFFTLGYVMGLHQSEAEASADDSSAKSELRSAQKPETVSKHPQKTTPGQPSTDKGTPNSSEWEFYHAGERVNGLECACRAGQWLFPPGRRYEPRGGCAGPRKGFAEEKVSRLCALAAWRQILPRASGPLRGLEGHRRRPERPGSRRFQSLREALMSRFAGPTLVASQTGAKTPDWLRLAIAAVSGAALSLSFTGLYLSLYSWICVAALLLAVIGGSTRVAFACGFFRALGCDRA